MTRLASPSPIAASSVDDLIGLLYDSAADAAKWNDLLRALAGHFRSFGSDLIHFDLDDNRFSMHLRHGFDHVPPSLVARFQELIPEDVRFLALRRRYGQRPAVVTVHCRMLVTDEELWACRCYREALQPAGIEYTLASHVIDGARLTTLAVMRGPSDPVFTETDHAEFHRLVPHLQRAVAIQRRLAELDFAARSSLDALDRIPTGIVVVDAELRVQAANAAARRLLDRQDGLLVREGRLIVEDRPVHAAMRAAVAAAIDGARDGRSPPERAFAIGGGRRSAAVSVRLGSLWGNHLKFGLAPLAEPLAVLFVAVPGEALRPSAAAIRVFLDLTEAEASLAAALAAGATLKDAACDLGRSQETCRSQLKSIFLKTGTARQADLVRHILSTPSWVDP